MFNKNKNENKKWFCMRCLQCFSSEDILSVHMRDCLVINGKQRVKLNEGSISFKNCSRQMKVPFKIYGDFESILKKCIESERGFDDECIDKNSSWSKKYQEHVPCRFGYKVVCIDDRFTKDVVVRLC